MSAAPGRRKQAKIPQPTKGPVVATGDRLRFAADAGLP